MKPPTTKSIRATLMDQEIGTMCVVGIWIYVKRSADEWMETDIRDWVDTGWLASLVSKEIEKHKATWALY